jgi:hypothetical protein
LNHKVIRPPLQYSGAQIEHRCPRNRLLPKAEMGTAY